MNPRPLTKDDVFLITEAHDPKTTWSIRPSPSNEGVAVEAVQSAVEWLKEEIKSLREDKEGYCVELTTRSEVSVLKLIDEAFGLSDTQINTAKGELASAPTTGEDSRTSRGQTSVPDVASGHSPVPRECDLDESKLICCQCLKKVDVNYCIPRQEIIARLDRLREILLDEDLSKGMARIELATILDELQGKL